jgi:hypothetical protein
MCKHAAELNFTLVKRKASNGHYQVFRRCNVCGQNFDGKFVSQDKIDNLDALPEVEAIPTLKCDYYQCDNPAEVHHVMPRSIAVKYSEEPDYWPTIHLCRKHHERWHDIVTPGLLRGTHD